MQTYKLISTELNLILYALIMEGFGVKYLDTHDPDFVTTNYNSPSNPALFFFVTVCVIYLCGVAQYLFRFLFSKCRPFKTEEFTDLCSICNISVLMFDDSFGGYYIHGKSPSG